MYKVLLNGNVAASESSSEKAVSAAKTAALRPGMLAFGPLWKSW